MKAEENGLVRAANFELATSATKFGRFNYLLLCLALLGGWASIFTTSVTSFIVPLAECDLQLSLQDKGWLTGVVYAGFISSGYMWGLVSDILGRRKLLIIGFLLNAVSVVLSGLTHNFTMMLVFKFLDGFTVCGPHAILMTALSEFHCAKYRAKLIMLNGVFICSGTFIAPLLGLGIATHQINLPIFNLITLHSWNVFVLLSAIPSLLSGLGAIFIPESPKFLMTQGRNNEALAIFQKIFSWNTGKDISEYPILKLEDETVNNIQVKSNIKLAKLLFTKPYGIKVFLIAVMYFAMLGGQNIIRLWFPQMLRTMDAYKNKYGYDSTLCDMMETVEPVVGKNTCELNFNASFFIYSMIPGIVVMVFSLSVGLVINKLGKNNLYLLCGVSSGILTIAFYFSPNTLATIILVTISTGLGSTNVNIMITIIVDLFPTNLRATAISIAYISGRLGSMIGNMGFPLLLQAGCLPPFFIIGFSMTAASLLIIFLPKTDMKALI